MYFFLQKVATFPLCPFPLCLMAFLLPLRTEDRRRAGLPARSCCAERSCGTWHGNAAGGGAPSPTTACCSVCECDRPAGRFMGRVGRGHSVSCVSESQYHRITEWLGLERSSKIIQLNPCHWQGCQLLDQAHVLQ